MNFFPETTVRRGDAGDGDPLMGVSPLQFGLGDRARSRRSLVRLRVPGVIRIIIPQDHEAHDLAPEAVVCFLQALDKTQNVADFNFDRTRLKGPVDRGLGQCSLAVLHQIGRGRASFEHDGVKRLAGGRVLGHLTKKFIDSSNLRIHGNTAPGIPRPAKIQPASLRKLRWPKSRHFLAVVDRRSGRLRRFTEKGPGY
jgi:hypothetical protein